MILRVAMAIVLLGGLAAGCAGSNEPIVAEVVKDYRTGELVHADHGVLLYGQDVLATPGQTVSLAARLRSPKIAVGIAGVTISFYEGGRLLGSAVTDGHGKAGIDYTASAGQHVIAVVPTRLPAHINKDYAHADKARAALLVDAQPAEAKFAVIDIDHTLLDDDWIDALVKPDAPALPHAVEVMKRIAQKYRVIYLTHRPRVLTAKSKQWLQDQAFPRGVVIASSGRQAFESNRDYKTAVLAELRRKHPGLEIGVGDQTSDIAAYVANGMTAYYLGQCQPTPQARRELAQDTLAMPQKEKIQAVRNWQQIERGIFDHERFTVEAFVREIGKSGP